MLAVLRYGVLFSAVLSVIGSSHSSDNATSSSTAPDGSSTASITSGTTSAISTVTSNVGNGTCISRTANYITHTLPQQCLRPDRVAANATKGAGTDGGLVRSRTSVTTSKSDTSVEEPGSLVPSPLSSVTTNDKAVPTVSPAAATAEGSFTSSSTAVATDSTTSESTTQSETEVETDSPLDNANFLSFEEWKKQNLAKAGLLAEPGNVPAGTDRQRPGINNALDSLGEEGEIDLDFSGFGGAPSRPRQQQAAYRSAEGATSGSSAPASHTPRSKDAGKTCKERTNYASFDCAATILKNNPECRSASSVLVENKDSYMLNTCSADNKFFIVELCNDILIDTVVLANYEFFSSIFRHFRVSVSDRYPVKMDKWRDLGTFEARNSREVQAFLIEHPQIWARYLRIEFLTHYGSEYYCPISLLRAHGTTMLEEIRPQDEVGHGENTDEEIAPEAEAVATAPFALEPASAVDELEKETTQDIPYVETDIEKPLVTISNETASTAASQQQSKLDAITGSTSTPTNGTDLLASVEVPNVDDMTCASNLMSTKTDAFETKPLDEPETSSTNPQDPAGTIFTDNSFTSVPSGEVEMNQSVRVLSSFENMNETRTINADPPSPRTSESINSTSTSASTASASVVLESGSKSNEFPASHPSSSTNSTRAASTASPASQPQPSTQESFFKSIHKRLQQLESNSTLSLQYIEEQSRILRDAFSKVEKRQISATTSFLTNLNETVMTELRGFRQSYDQLWQSTVIELEGQREQYQREMLALSTRLTLVADELVWQKRMGIVQSTLLLLCLGLVLFARGSGNGYLEVPLMQQMMNKSQAALGRAGWESPTGSPSPESRSPARLFRRKLWRSITEPGGGASGHVTDATGTDSRPQSKEGPDVYVEPPSPVSEDVVVTPASTDEVELEQGIEGNDADDEDEVSEFRESRSGPSTPRGTRERVDMPPDEVGVDLDPFER